MIEDWYQRLPTDARADFDWVIQELAGTENWRDSGRSKPLHGKQHGFVEIIFKTHNVQYRPVGRYGPQQREFSLLVGCSKKQRNYTPPDALDLAVTRWGLLQQGRGSLCEHFL
jgi:Phage derived protein Gp49-like (DUF891)